jgi:hypothetical protein
MGIDNSNRLGGGDCLSSVPSTTALVLSDHDYKLVPNMECVMAEKLEWKNMTVDDLSPEIVKLHNAVRKAEAERNAALEKALKKKGIMPQDKYLRVSVRGDRYGVAFASTPQGEGNAHISLK